MRASNMMNTSVGHLCPIEQAIAQLQRACAVLEGYASLVPGGRSIKRRQQLLRRAADAIAGGCGADLLRDACGGDNITARRIAHRVETLRIFSGGPNLTKEVREFVINQACNLVPDHTRSSLNSLGCSLGKDLYKAVTEFAESAEVMYVTPKGKYRGRARSVEAEKVPAAWAELARDSGRLRASGESVKVFHGGRSKAIRAVVDATQCSAWAAKAYKPRDIVPAARLTDLCPLCEGLRAARLALVAHARDAGAEMEHPGEEAGQKDAVAPGDAAADFLQSDDAPKLVADLLSQYDALAWHERLAQQLARKYKDACASGVVVSIDFGSKIALTSTRGDSAEFFEPLKIGRFGVAISRPVDGGCPQIHYVDVCFLRHKHSASVASAALQVALALATKEGWVQPGDVSVKFFCDKGSHFASEEMAHAVLVRALPDVPDVELCYHPSYHGKSVCDGHFAHAKKKVAALVVEKWPLHEGAVRKKVIAAMEQLERTRCTFLHADDLGDGGQSRLCVKNISSIHSIRRIDAVGSARRFFVEGQEATLKVKAKENAVETTLNPWPNLDALKGGCNTSLVKLARTARQQKERLERAKSWAKSRPCESGPLPDRQVS